MTCCGFLQAALEDSAERVRTAVAAGSDLEGLQRSCANAWSLYKRTRPPASPESAARARDMGSVGMHPLLAAAAPRDGPGGLEAQVGAELQPKATIKRRISSGLGPAHGSINAKAVSFKGAAEAAAPGCSLWSQCQALD